MSRRGQVGRALNILVLRGLGSGISVLLALVVARFLGTDAAAKFFLLFNITTIAAVCFRWGMDEIIVRRVATAGTDAQVQVVASRLLMLSHTRVTVWVVTAGLVVAIAALTPLPSTIGITWVELLAMLAVSAAIALSACGGRVYQGVGRVNFATLILNILIPGLALVGLVTLVAFNVPTSALGLFAIYGTAATLSYVTVVWVLPVARPQLRPKDPSGILDQQGRSDLASANRLGGVVLSQQILNWGALLIVPTVYGGAIYTSFNVDFKLASLVSLVMLAVNFTFASRLASLYARRELSELRRLTRQMTIAVVSASVLFGGLLLLSRGAIYKFANIEMEHDFVLVLLVLGQVFFALSAVFSLVLTMSHQERFLLVTQGAVSVLGLTAFAVLSVVGSIEWATGAFLLSYGLLTPMLGRRVWRVLNG